MGDPDTTGFQYACGSTHVGEGDVRIVHVNDKAILLARWKGKVYALSAYCPHNGGLLEEGRLVDGEVECPRHGARFLVLNGGAMRPPAEWGLATYEVNEENGKISVAL